MIDLFLLLLLLLLLLAVEILTANMPSFLPSVGKGRKVRPFGVHLGAHPLPRINETYRTTNTTATKFSPNLNFI